MPSRRALRGLAALSLVLVAVLLAGTGPVRGGEPDEDRLTFTVTPDEAPGGSEIVARGEGCGTGTRLVEVAFSDLGAERATAEATADGTGAWEVTLQVPEIVPGDYGVVATCSGEEIYAPAPFRVLSDDGALDISDDDGSTDTRLLILGALGALLLIGGGVMVYVTRRRGNDVTG